MKTSLRFLVVMTPAESAVGGASRVGELQKCEYVAVQVRVSGAGSNEAHLKLV